jgi:hypothetical protein
MNCGIVNPIEIGILRGIMKDRVRVASNVLVEVNEIEGNLDWRLFFQLSWFCGIPTAA